MINWEISPVLDGQARPVNTICQSCGYDIEKVGPVIRGDCLVLEDGNVILRGRLLSLNKPEREVFHAVMRAGLIRSVVLADRFGYADASIPVMVSNINKKFLGVGADAPIMSTRFYHLI